MGKVSLTLPLASILLALCALQPSSTEAAWNGWARCEVDIQGPGYLNRGTHTWFVTGAAPTPGGIGSWSAVGYGHLDQGNPASTSQHAEWSINPYGNAISGGQFGVTTMSGVLSINRLSAQLGQGRGITGYVQQTISNRPRTPVSIAATQYEWGFPQVRGPAGNPTLTGSSTVTNVPAWGTMQATGSTIAAACTWSFADGSTPPPPPPPQRPADPCLSLVYPPVKTTLPTYIAGVVPNSFAQNEPVTVCGAYLSMAALDQPYAKAVKYVDSPSTAPFVRLGDRSVMAINPSVSASGDRLTFTAGGLYEIAKPNKVLTPVAQARGWNGVFGISLQNQTDPLWGPEKVAWRAK